MADAAPQSPARHPALVNADRALAIEDELRAWPTFAQTQLMDKRCVQTAKRLRHAPKWERERAFIMLETLRFRFEPTAAELVRVGVPIDKALERARRRARQFERLFWG